MESSFKIISLGFFANLPFCLSSSKIFVRFLQSSSPIFHEVTLQLILCFECWIVFRRDLREFLLILSTKNRSLLSGFFGVDNFKLCCPIFLHQIKDEGCSHPYVRASLHLEKLIFQKMHFGFNSRLLKAHFIEI